MTFVKASTASLFVLFLLSTAAFGQKYHPDVQAVRDVIEKWDAGYRAMDPKAMSATIDEGYEMVNRFGQYFVVRSQADYENMWAWTFTNIYKGKPGPKHNIQHVKLVTSDVAIVQTTATRTEPVIVSDGTKIPPFTQHASFVLVRRPEGWRITSHNIHNRFPDPDKSERLPWETAKPAN